MTAQNKQPKQFENRPKRQQTRKPPPIKTGTQRLIQRSCPGPAKLSPRQVQILQRQIGNQTLSRFVVQAKMNVGPVGDKYEQEAEQVAARVVSTINSGSVTQREEEETLQAKPIDTIQRVEKEDDLQMRAGVQREVLDDDKDIQMKAQHGLSGGEVGNEVEQSIRQSKGSGQALPDVVEQEMSSAFGADFSAVNIHTDSRANTLNRSLNAKAFTTGKDIYFGAGQYDPISSSGKKLLAHELTHVVQQGGADSIQRCVNERASVQYSRTAPTIQRWPWNEDRISQLKLNGAAPPNPDFEPESRWSMAHDAFGVAMAGSKTAGVPLGIANSEANARHWGIDKEPWNDDGPDSKGFRDSRGGAGLAGAASATNFATGGLQSFSDAVDVAKNSKKVIDTWKDDDKGYKDLYGALNDHAETTVKSSANGLSTLASGVTAAAKMAKAAGADVGVTDFASAGLGSGISALSSAFQVCTGSIKMTLSAIDIIKARNAADLGSAAMELTKNIIEEVQSIIGVVNGVWGVVSKIHSVFKVAEISTKVAGPIGAAISIASSMMNILKKLFDLFKKTIQVAKAAYRFHVLKRLHARRGLHADPAADSLKLIQKKRIRRQMIPMAADINDINADLISIAGAAVTFGVTIVGSVAYGAGIIGGFATNLATGLISSGSKLGSMSWRSGQSLVRTAKQKGRDVAASPHFSNKNGGTKTSKLPFFNLDKTSKKKHQERTVVAQLLLQDAAALPDYDSDADMSSYEELRIKIESTGVNMGKFYKSTDQQVRLNLLIEAMKERG